jgi:hypothetical protein
MSHLIIVPSDLTLLQQRVVQLMTNGCQFYVDIMKYLRSYTCSALSVLYSQPIKKMKQFFGISSNAESGFLILKYGIEGSSFFVDLSFIMII